jgi:hypothetical protein
MTDNNPNKLHNYGNWFHDSHIFNLPSDTSDHKKMQDGCRIDRVRL